MNNMTTMKILIPVERVDASAEAHNRIFSFSLLCRYWFFYTFFSAAHSIFFYDNFFFIFHSDLFIISETKTECVLNTKVMCLLSAGS